MKTNTIPGRGEMVLTKLTNGESKTESRNAFRHWLLSLSGACKKLGQKGFA